MKKGRLPALPSYLSLALLTSAACEGAVVFGSIDGTVSSITETGAGDAPDSVVAGQSVSISFSYDSSAGYSPAGPTNGLYTTGLDLAMDITINGLNWSGSDTDGLVGIGDEFFDGSQNIDRLVYEINTAPGAPLPVWTSFPNQITGTNSVSFLSLVLQDTTPPAGFLSSLALPDDLSDLNVPEITFSSFRIQTNDPVTGDSYQINITPDTNTLTLAVPEPSTTFLFLATGTLLIVRRRH